MIDWLLPRSSSQETKGAACQEVVWWEIVKSSSFFNLHLGYYDDEGRLSDVEVDKGRLPLAG